jgi:DNA repair exonuclease SbcCD ATPase subunit
LEAENAAALRSVPALQRENMAIDLERGRRGFLRRVFASADLDKREQHLVERRGRIEPLLQRLDDLRRRISNFIRQIEYYKDVAARAYDAAEAEKKANEKEERAKERREQERALLARAKSQTRTLTAALRRRLTEQMKISPACPYCGQEFRDNDAQRDHIYPVKEGGLSTSKNMVFVYSACNRLKKNLTLNQFIDEHSLDRDLVFDRLAEPGKKY